MLPPVWEWGFLDMPAGAGDFRYFPSEGSVLVKVGCSETPREVWDVVLPWRRNTSPGTVRAL